MCEESQTISKNLTWTGTFKSLFFCLPCERQPYRIVFVTISSREHPLSPFQAENPTINGLSELFCVAKYSCTNANNQHTTLNSLFVKRFFCHLIPCLWLAGTVAFAQEAKAPALYWRHITDGLSHNRVTTILEDSQGFLWIGTYSGLNRFDGYEFRIFENQKEEERSLPGNLIQTIFEDRNGDLWIGSDGGLARFNRNDEKFDRWKVDNSTHQDNDHVNAIIETDDGTLWVGTGSGIRM